MIPNVEYGLDILWRSSFKNNKPFKENLAFFVPGGLLILPNHNNTCYSARLSALPVTVLNKKLFVRFQDEWLEVFATIHTHPDTYILPMPTPGKDYQFCYLGIHNYVMDHRNLYDAYKDSFGNECYRRLGNRTAYAMLPLTLSPDSNVVGKSIGQDDVASLAAEVYIH